MYLCTLDLIQRFQAQRGHEWRCLPSPGLADAIRSKLRAEMGNFAVEKSGMSQKDVLTDVKKGVTLCFPEGLPFSVRR